MSDIYTLLIRTSRKPRITTQTGQSDRLCGKKTPLSQLLSNCLCKAFGHTYVKSFNHTRKY